MLVGYWPAASAKTPLAPSVTLVSGPLTSWVAQSADGHDEARVEADGDDVGLAGGERDGGGEVLALPAGGGLVLVGDLGDLLAAGVPQAADVGAGLVGVLVEGEREQPDVVGHGDLRAELVGERAGAAAAVADVEVREHGRERRSHERAGARRGGERPGQRRRQGGAVGGGQAGGDVHRVGGVPGQRRGGLEADRAAAQGARRRGDQGPAGVAQRERRPVDGRGVQRPVEGRGDRRLAVHAGRACTRDHGSTSVGPAGAVRPVVKVQSEGASSGEPSAPCTPSVTWAV